MKRTMNGKELNVLCKVMDLILAVFLVGILGNIWNGHIGFEVGLTIVNIGALVWLVFAIIGICSITLKEDDGE